MGIVTAINKQDRNPERVSVFIDGEFRFGLSMVIASRLRIGQLLSDAEIQELLDQEAHEAAYQRSLKIISRRAQSTEEIRKKLRRKQVQEQVIESVIERLTSSGWLDDLEFAGAWVENRLSFRPRGKKMLRHELQKKGISKEIVEATLSNFDDEQAAYQAAKKAYRRYRSLPEELAQQRLLAFLSRRGFNYGLCRRVVHETLEAASVAVEESEVET